MIMSRFIFRLHAVVALLICMTGCKGGQKSLEMGPADTVIAFHKAAAVGDWAEAQKHCDAAIMREYIDTYKAFFENLEKKDEGAMKVARSILDDLTITIDEVRKEEDKRTVRYTLGINGMSKTKKSTLVKKEGAWKVEKIIEVN